jgi:hypothetical protein
MTAGDGTAPAEGARRLVEGLLKRPDVTPAAKAELRGIVHHTMVELEKADDEKAVAMALDLEEK